ncbi:MAG: hypothetical protein Q9207_006583 [Kuettlingeria erythrocarpa]
MPSNTITFMATAFALLSATNGHMIMLTPPVYGNASIDSSPLDASGSDFPCKQRPGVYDLPPTGVAKMAIGAPQTLSFLGSAVHGGGSCQISLTKDTKPTKDSKWMVIHSIEGGCPAKAAGNLGDSATARVAKEFQYKIPQGIAPGEYTLAWTWFNQIGAREMYMNCAPISVSGGGKTRRDRDDDASLNATETYASDQIFKRETSFPDMFLANIGNGCSTVERFDVKFPNPGASVELAGDASKLGTPEGSCGPSGAASSKGSGGSSSAAAAPAAPAAPAAGGAAPVASSASAGSNTGVSAAPASTPSPSMTIQAIPPPGVSASTGAAAMQSVQSAAQSVANAAQSIASGMGAPAAPAPTASGSGASAGSSNASSGESSGSGASNATPSSNASSSSSSGGSIGAATGSTSCSTAGQMVCSDDGKMFGTCGPDKTAKMMPVAAGTACKGGQIGFGKRSAKYAKAYRA